MAKIKPAGKIAIVLGLAGAMAFAYLKFGDKLIPEGDKAEDVKGMMAGDDSSSSSSGTATAPSGGANKCVEVGVVTWGGYAGGQYWNNGFKDNPGSRFHQDNICVNFHVMDDFNNSRAAFKSGKMDLMWVTMDALPTEAGNYGEPVKFLFQADWSRGGDAIVTTANVSSVGELAGKKIAVAPATPSHTFLLWMLDMAGLSFMDVEVIEVASAIDAASAFKAGQVEAAVVWSPDDADCVASVKGAKVLTNTKQATHIIADGFMVKQSVLDRRRTEMKALVEGWLKGAAELNDTPANKQKAAKILSDGFGADVDEEFAYGAINNVRLTTYGDNLDFFGLNPGYSNVTGKDLFTKMAKVYGRLKLADNVPDYSQVVDVDFIKSLSLQGETVQAEKKVVFAAPTVAEKTATAVASKPVRVTFPHGSSTLDENAKALIRYQFVDSARAFPNARIRIEGNTDATGSAAANKRISLQRAQAVVDFLVREEGMDANRFVVVGNGPGKPLCTEQTDICFAKNRRTDFQILEQ